MNKLSRFVKWGRKRISFIIARQYYEFTNFVFVIDQYQFIIYAKLQGLYLENTILITMPDRNGPDHQERIQAVY